MTIKSTNHLTHIATFCALLYSNSALCAELVEYDHTFLMGKDASNIDLSRYTEGNPHYLAFTMSVCMLTINPS